jgi:hypothetical protein
MNRPTIRTHILEAIIRKVTPSAGVVALKNGIGESTHSEQMYRQSSLGGRYALGGMNHAYPFGVIIVGADGKDSGELRGGTCVRA